MNVFELFAKLTLDKSEYDDGLDSAEGKANSVGSAIGSALGTAGRVALGAVTAAAGGVAALTTSSVKGYSEYEQLIGGVEKLFGTGGQSLEEWAAANDLVGDEAVSAWNALQAAQDTVLTNAANGWQSATMSANDYLNQAIVMSGALLGSLDYDSQAAAEYTDRAITDMADIANTYGFSMDQVSGIYTSVSRGLYQTIDTLTAGAFAGTKEGALDLVNSMAELVDIQEQLGITVEAGSLDYANFVNAMSVYNEYTGVAGTTQREASETIQGSLAMMRASWDNLVVGMADSDADISSLMSNVATSARTALGNLVPVVSQALQSMGSLIREVTPIISAELPGIINDLLPPLLDAAVQLVSGLVSALPSILGAITSAIPVLLQVLIPAILEILPQFIQAAIDLVGGLVLGIAEAAPTLIPAIIDAILMMVDTLTQPDNIMMLVEAAILLCGGIAEGILNSIPNIMRQLPVILTNITSGLLSMIPSLTATVVGMVGDLITSAMGTIYNLGPSIIEAVMGIGTRMSENFTTAINGIREIFEAAWNFITNGFAGLNIELPHINLPHFSLNGSFSLNPPSVPTLSVDWYAKAMNAPIMLSEATIFGAAGGSLLGGGEAGDEMIYGRNNLMRDIADVVGSAIGNQPNVIQVYIGSEKVDEFVVSSNQRSNFISGGRG